MDDQKQNIDTWWLADAKDVVLPQGCRMLDYSILNLITDLKAQQAHDIKFKKATQDIIQNQGEILKSMHSRIEKLNLDIERLDKVYYHVFPERLAGDIKLEDQLYKLKSKRPQDGNDPEK